MNKSKFKTVKFKPFDMELHYWNQEYWISHLCYGGDSNNSVRFTDSFIESYPEFFEVEKAGDIAFDCSSEVKSEVINRLKDILKDLQNLIKEQ
jgi:hypothetical protein